MQFHLSLAFGFQRQRGQRILGPVTPEYGLSFCFVPGFPVKMSVPGSITTGCLLGSGFGIANSIVLDLPLNIVAWKDDRSGNLQRHW